MMEEHEPAEIGWRSCAATRRGPNHPVNEDSYGDLGEAGIYVVADGVGGHTDGGLASRAIVQMLSEVALSADTLDARVEIVEQALQSVNGALWRESRQRGERVVIASTVAALMLAENYAVCLWAGDSRIYVNRAGHLYRLTRDHNEANSTHPLSGHGEALTRAVGSSEDLNLERLVTTAEPGDKFLVCSDGVTKVMSDGDLARFLEDPLEGLAARIIAAVVEKGGNDDATAIIVRYGSE
jgi:serine/threonine protein phosphatase PrpC